MPVWADDPVRIQGGCLWMRRWVSSGRPHWKDIIRQEEGGWQVQK